MSGKNVPLTSLVAAGAVPKPLEIFTRRATAYTSIRSCGNGGLVDDTVPFEHRNLVGFVIAPIPREDVMNIEFLVKIGFDVTVGTRPKIDTLAQDEGM